MYRIVEVKNSDGCYYIIQAKVFLFWRSIKSRNHITGKLYEDRYSSLFDAKLAAMQLPVGWLERRVRSSKLMRMEWEDY